MFNKPNAFSTKKNLASLQNIREAVYFIFSIDTIAKNTSGKTYMLLIENFFIITDIQDHIKQQNFTNKKRCPKKS
ncbi:hypothetical protein [Lysinibacillus sp. NPDC096259]|uniref:hypothetical protein n=1 Tax=Lysinibacillus sp. NPDC096259 TaxID=3390583 RepID=UPI003D039DC6